MDLKLNQIFLFFTIVTIIVQNIVNGLKQKSESNLIQKLINGLNQETKHYRPRDKHSDHHSLNRQQSHDIHSHKLHDDKDKKNQNINFVFKNTNNKNKVNKRADKNIYLDLHSKDTQKHTEEIENKVKQLLELINQGTDSDHLDNVGRSKIGRCNCKPLRNNAMRAEEIDDNGEDLNRCGCGGGRSKSSIDTEDLKENSLSNGLRSYKTKGSQGLDLLKELIDYVEDDDKSKDKQQQKGGLGKKYKINDNLELMVLDVSNLDNFLDTEQDYDDEHEDNVASDGDLTMNKTRRSQDKDISITPEEFFYVYRKFRKEITEAATNYVKNVKNAEKDIDFLKSHQKKRLSRLKNEIQSKHIAYNDDRIQKQVADIVLTQSTSRVLPHNEKNDNIYIPSWFHKLIIRYQDANAKNLRAKKSLLPMTTQQRQRLHKRHNKSSIATRTRNSTKKKIRLQNTNSRLQKYGVPFEVLVTGLGQLKKS